LSQAHLRNLLAMAVGVADEKGRELLEKKPRGSLEKGRGNKVALVSEGKPALEERKEVAVRDKDVEWGS
jgi:hypothetical protein